MDRGAWWATVHGVSKRTRHDVVTNTFTVIAVWGSIVLNLFTYSSAIFKFYAWVEGEKGVTDVQQSAAGGVLAGAGDLVFPAHCCALPFSDTVSKNRNFLFCFSHRQIACQEYCHFSVSLVYYIFIISDWGFVCLLVEGVFTFSEFFGKWSVSSELTSVNFLNIFW